MVLELGVGGGGDDIDDLSVAVYTSAGTIHWETKTTLGNKDNTWEQRELWETKTTLGNKDNIGKQGQHWEKRQHWETKTALGNKDKIRLLQ